MNHLASDTFLYATQYYRAPTPLLQEWAADFEHIGKLGLNAVQIRLQWRQNELQEGVYRFDDVDRLMELAEQHQQRVVIKFLLETAPQYVFDRYGGTRRTFKGAPILPASHGACYVGGWWPCFDNPQVCKAAERFVRTVVERYRDNRSLILWNAWNEPRSRPAEDCACQYSVARYRLWLKDNYRSIDDFNRFYGVAEESFETIALPGLTGGYWDYFLFRKWRAQQAIPDQVRMVADTIRRFDKSRPVMCHVGCCGAQQPTFVDISDDTANATTVDIYGTSYPVPIHLKNRCDDIWCGLYPDFIRGVSQDFFVHEIYPDWGKWTEPATPEELRYKLWNCLAHGAKGLCFWQYRAERLGNEDNLSGLVEMNGDRKPVTAEAEKMGTFIRDFGDLVMKMRVPKADIALIHDFDSALISKIEEGIHTFEGGFSPRSDAEKYYHFTFAGWYKLLSDLNLPADILDSRNLRLEGYRMVILPGLQMVNPELAAVLSDFARTGGLLFCDEGFGLRQQNTWLNPTRKILSALDHSLDIQWKYRVKKQGIVNLGDFGAVATSPYITKFDGEIQPVARFDSGDPAIGSVKMGLGRIIVSGCPVGYSYWRDAQPDPWKKFIAQMIIDRHLRQNPVEHPAPGIESRLLVSDTHSLIVILSRSETTSRIDAACLGRNPQELLGMANFAEGVLTLSPDDVAVIKVETPDAVI